MNSLQVNVLSDGIAIGEVKKIVYQNYSLNRGTAEEEKIKLKRAIEDSIQEIEKIKQNHPENQDYLTMQILLLSDPVLLNKANECIESGLSAIESITTILNEYMNSLLDATSNYLKERIYDFSDIKKRILNNISGEKIQEIDQPCIVDAEELYPSFLIQNRKYLLGVITKTGGFSSHSAILCRQFHIPYVTTPKELDSKFIIIDTRKQQILLKPTPQEIQHYTEVLEKLSKEVFSAVPHQGFQFLANVTENLDLQAVEQYGFDGVGLYRTEIIFMNTDHPLTLEEQTEIYSEAVEMMKEKKICFRTFDIGDDKTIPYIKSYQKGIENYIHNPIVFKTQIEALFLANKYNSIRIMFPMIYSSSEFDFLRKWALQIQKEMKNTSQVEFGIMLETNEALEQIESFTNVDFISIGTNDLVLDIYHVHREDQKEALNEYIQDLMQKLKKVVSFCDEHRISLSVCGELASIGPALRKFIEIGIKNFSVTPLAIKVLNHVYKEFF